MSLGLDEKDIGDRHIVIFDGECNFCNASVAFIIQRDPRGLFVFTPMQSDCATRLMQKFGIEGFGVNGVGAGSEGADSEGADSEGGETIILIKNNQYYIFSTAALEIARDLKWPWCYLAALRFIPAVARDFFYKKFSRYRYALFGRRELCLVPDESVASRFLAP